MDLIQNPEEDGGILYNHGDGIQEEPDHRTQLGHVQRPDYLFRLIKDQDQDYVKYMRNEDKVLELGTSF